MVNYEQDVITVSDGALVEIGPDDIIIGLESDGTTFLVLRKVAKR